MRPSFAIGSCISSRFKSSKYNKYTMNFFKFSAPAFEKYITIHGVNNGQTYNYAKRNIFNIPVVRCTRHRPKCAVGESWVYVAISHGAELRNLGPLERLYVGAQTQDRMFRGDGLNGDNFHHAEMRNGKNNSNLIQYLQTGKEVDIYRAPSKALARLVSAHSELNYLNPLLTLPISTKKHLGYWFEQAVLHYEYPQWCWNSAGAEKTLSKVLTIALP